MNNADVSFAFSFSNAERLTTWHEHFRQPPSNLRSLIKHLLKCCLRDLCCVTIYDETLRVDKNIVAVLTSHTSLLSRTSPVNFHFTFYSHRQDQAK